MHQNVFILGATGNVGGELVKQIYNLGDCNNQKHQNPTKIMLTASRREKLFSKKGLNQIQGEGFSIVGVGENYSNLDELLNIANGLGEEVVFIDATDAREPMLDLYNKIIFESRHKIITANKAPLVLASTKNFRDLTADTSRFGYRCSVMAGAGTIPWIRKSVDLGEKINSMAGVLSGTLGFICSELNDGKYFSEALLKAVEEGYTEPDARNDLSGRDVANKGVLLARTAGFDINYKDIELRRLLDIGEMDWIDEKGKFLDVKLQDRVDLEFGMKVEEARSENRALSYVFRMYPHEKSKPRITVGLEYVPVRSYLNTQDNDNRIIIGTEEGFNYDSAPVKGAGVRTTARNMRADLIDLLHNRKIAYPN